MLHRDLLATIATPSKASSKQEELVDKLLEWSGYFPSDDQKQDAFLAKLSAPTMVPYLVKHLNDRRMTRSSFKLSYFSGGFRTSVKIKRVGDVAARLLADHHAGEKEVKSWFNFDGSEKVTDVAKAQAWLKEWESNR